jgi:hypothetical protein
MKTAYLMYGPCDEDSIFNVSYKLSFYVLIHDLDPLKS